VSAVVEVDGVEIRPVPLLAIFNKPIGVECTMRQVSKAKHQSLSLAVTDPMVLKVLHPVGRLDADSSGLLLFSSDGQLTRVLLNPSYQVPRGYEAVVEGCAAYGA
jgi:pseudouridine synthase